MSLLREILRTYTLPSLCPGSPCRTYSFEETGKQRSRTASESGGRAGERPPPRGESRLRNTTDGRRSPSLAAVGVFAMSTFKSQSDSCRVADNLPGRSSRCYQIAMFSRCDRSSGQFTGPVSDSRIKSFAIAKLHREAERCWVYGQAVNAGFP